MLEKVVEAPIVKNLNSALYDVLSSITLHQYIITKYPDLENTKGEWTDITYSVSSSVSDVYLYGTDKKATNISSYIDTTWFACSLEPFSISISAKYEDTCSSGNSINNSYPFYGKATAEGSVSSKEITYNGKTYHIAQLSVNTVFSGADKSYAINASPSLRLTSREYEQYENKGSNYNGYTGIYKDIDPVQIVRYDTVAWHFTTGFKRYYGYSGDYYYRFASERSYNDVIMFLDYTNSNNYVKKDDYVNGVKALAYIILFGYERKTILWNGSLSDDPYVFVDGVAYNHVSGYIYNEEMEDFETVWNKSGRQKEILKRPQVIMPEGGTT